MICRAYGSKEGKGAITDVKIIMIRAHELDDKEDEELKAVGIYP